MGRKRHICPFVFSTFCVAKSCAIKTKECHDLANRHQIVLGMPSAPKMAGTSWISSSLAGKALDIFGGGTEHRKLRAICSIFPHDDNIDNANILNVYSEAFWYLSSRAQSSDSAKATIARLLLAQIRLEQTLHLTQALKTLPRLDKQHILSAIMTTRMNDIEQLYDTRYQKSEDTILVTMTERVKLVEQPSMLASLTFSYEFVILPSFSRSAIDAPEHWSPLLKASRATLRVLSRSETNHNIVLQHPVCFIWMDCHLHPPAYSLEPPSPLDALLVRSTAWREVAEACIRRRIMMIFIDSLWKSNVFEIENLEACADIVEFARPLCYDSEIVELACLTMLKHIVFDGESTAHLISALAACSLGDSVHICSGIIQLWLECVEIEIQNQLIYGGSSRDNVLFSKTHEFRLALGTEPINIDRNFYDREKTHLFERVSNVDSALYKIMFFCTEAARTTTIIRRALLDAGALSLVTVAFITSDFLPSTLMDKGRKRSQKSAHTAAVHGHYHKPFRIPLEVIRTDALTLSSLMRDATFRESWSDKRFRMRKHLSSSLVNALLGDSDAANDGYACTRALFQKIVG